MIQKFEMFEKFKEILNDKCKEHIFCQTFGLKSNNIDEIAEQMKEVGEWQD